MSKTNKLAFIMILLVGILAFTAMAASAATTPAATTGAIAVTVVQDDGKTPITNFSSNSIAVKNSANETLDQSIDYLVASSNGIYTVSNLAYADTYYVSFTRDGQTETSIVTATISNTAKKATLKWSSSSTYTAAKSGTIAGLTVDGSGAVLTGVTVKAFTTNTIYETTSAAVTGAYKLFVPAGSYTLVIVGKDTGTDYANISQKIKVVAGQAAGPMTDLNGRTLWSSISAYDATLGLSGLTIVGTSTSVYGKAYKGMTVSAYAYDATNPIIFRFLGSQKATATGTFNIKLREYPAGKKIFVMVVDTAFNSAIDLTNVITPVSKMTATLTPDSDGSTDLPITIIEKEPTGVVSGNFNKNITAVKATYGGVTTTLTPDQYLKNSSGKLTINKGVLSAKTYTIDVLATGYNDVSFDQAVVVSNITPPTTLSGTFTLKAGGGTVSGSAYFSAIGTAGAGNSLVYVVSAEKTIQFKLGCTLTGSTALAASTDITGVDATTKKYIHVYEISAANAVVKAKVITLTAAQIKS